MECLSIRNGVIIFVAKTKAMVSKQEIVEAACRKRERFNQEKSYPRELLSATTNIPRDVAIVISGIRRCGKSTLMGQIMTRMEAEGMTTFYCNFDTPKVYGFSFDDFKLIDEILHENRYDILLFDEIQVVEGWEVYVRGKLDEGYKVVVTGSNASMLSRELGTKLTGRHITRELFPFSYQEFCGYKGVEYCQTSFEDYLQTGGFPKYVSSCEVELLEQLVDDILYRDIAVRYNLRDERTLKLTLSLLLANVGNLVSASKLKQLLGIKSTTTVSDYLSYFEQSYLLSFVPRFSFSIKTRLVNPKKVYCIDNGIVAAVNRDFSKNLGHKLENMMFCHLRNRHRELFYFSENGHECDFIIAHNGIPHTAIQVCYQLTAENREREINGLREAMNVFNLEKGWLITLNQTDRISSDGKYIEVIPAYNAVNFF